MINLDSFRCRICFGIILVVLFSSTTFASDFVGIYCVDINTVPPTRIFEIAVSYVGGDHYSLHGIQKDGSGNQIGSLTGSASVSHWIPMAVNTTYSKRPRDGVSTYQFNFNKETFSGSYWSITQEANNGLFRPLEHNYGEATLVDCNDPLTTFAITYIDNGNGTVSDINTGLIWQQVGSNSWYTWQGAINYCSELELGGSPSWRLPSLIELESIVDSTGVPAMINPVFSSAPSNYWSSTSHAEDPDLAWRVSFSSGVPHGWEKLSHSYVRCVR